MLGTPEFAQLEKDDRVAAAIYRNDLLEQVVASLPAHEIFERAQALGLAWSPIRRPEENLDDPHFAARGSFATIHHPELGRDLRYPAPSPAMVTRRISPIRAAPPGWANIRMKYCGARARAMRRSANSPASSSYTDFRNGSRPLYYLHTGRPAA